MKQNTCHLLSLLFVLLVLTLTACTDRVPTDYQQSDKLPSIYPDYTNVTVPVNIAPLTFQMNHDAQEMVVRFSVGTDQWVCGGQQAQPDMKTWRTMMEKARDKSISVEVFARYERQWTRYKPFSIYVSKDSIDPYISYRLISPSFVTYEELTINQRCLENYEESVVFDNMLCSTEKEGQCINCHHYQNYNPQRMQFHARQNLGGTVIAIDGKIRKVNMKNDSILSAGVYPAWHPKIDFIVYSTNKTHQTFHTIDPNKIEVFDDASDLIAYDINSNEVTNIENRRDEFEVFPCWSPDGRWLYYCSAHFEMPDTVKDKGIEVIRHAYDIKYNLYRKSFDPVTKQFGERQLVLDAAAMNKSATLPRISPDGRYLMFTMGAFGVFHIWHHDADIWLISLRDGKARNMKEINSPDTESYHSWSSNGRWVIVSSRRTDGCYTRPFIAHVDSQGRGSKPFELPSKNPDRHRQLMKSYNIPEFMRGPVTIKPQQFADVLKSDGDPAVKYVKKNIKGK